MHSAVNPLVMLAKQHFSPDAAPISREMWFRFSVEERCGPESGESESLCGPDTGMLGRFHSYVPVSGGLEMVVWGSEEVLREGAPPMMPPSINLMEGAEV